MSLERAEKGRGGKKKERVRKLEEHRKIKKSPGGEFISHWSLSGEHHKTQTVSHHWKTSGPAGPAVLVTESDKLPPPLQWKTARDTVVHAPQSVCGLQQFQTINWNVAECNVQNCTCCNFWIKINVWQCDAEVINVLCCLHYEAHCSYNKCVLGAFCICINEKREMRGGRFWANKCNSPKENCQIYSKSCKNTYRVSDITNEPPCWTKGRMR